MADSAPRSTKSRRTKAEIDGLRTAICETAERYQPLSLRQLFYRLVAASVVDKTDNDYHNVVLRLAGLLREEGELPWDWIVDNTRWMRKPNSYGSLSELLDEQTELYRRDLWRDQEDYVEVWCESDSIACVLGEATMGLDVPLMPARGFASSTFLHSAARMIRSKGKPSYIYYFGDYDPSGKAIAEDIEKKLKHYGAAVVFEVVALTAEQVDVWNLPTRPVKRKGNTHAKRFKGSGSVELEALEPSLLLELTRSAVGLHIDQQALRRTERVEEEERETLQQMAEQLGC